MVRVATLDDHVLSVIGAALNYCDELSLKDLEMFIATYLPGGRSGVPDDDVVHLIVEPRPAAAGSRHLRVVGEGVRVTGRPAGPLVCLCGQAQ